MNHFLNYIYVGWEGCFLASVGQINKNNLFFIGWLHGNHVTQIMN